MPLCCFQRACALSAVAFSISSCAALFLRHLAHHAVSCLVAFRMPVFRVSVHLPRDGLCCAAITLVAYAPAPRFPRTLAGSVLFGGMLSPFSGTACKRHAPICCHAAVLFFLSSSLLPSSCPLHRGPRFRYQQHMRRRLCWCQAWRHSLPKRPSCAQRCSCAPPPTADRAACVDRCSLGVSGGRAGGGLLLPPSCCLPSCCRAGWRDDLSGCGCW